MIKDFIKSNEKIIYIVVILLTLVLIAFLAINETTNHGKYVEISYDELQNKLNNKESFILFIGADSCSHCSDYKKLIQKIENRVVLYYIDLDKVSEDEYKWLKSKFNFSGTPYTSFIENGSQDSNGYVDGAVYEKLIKMLIKYNYIEGE